MNSIRTGTLLLAAVALLALSACGKQEAPPPAASTPAKTEPPPPAAPAAPTAPAAPAAPVAATKLVSLDLTNNVDASGKVGGAAATMFAPNDKIYALVKTNNNGTSPSTVSAHWEYQGGVTVNDSTQSVMAAGESVTTFHIEKPSGWPPGKYKVTIAIDGQQVGAKEFEVK